MSMKVMFIAVCALTVFARLNAADSQENKDAKETIEVAPVSASVSVDKSGSNEAADENKAGEVAKADTKDAK